MHLGILRKLHTKHTLVASATILDELEWPSLETRREQSSLAFFYDVPCAFHILVIKLLKNTVFGYLLELLHIKTFRSSTYNLKGYNVCGLSGHFFACLKLNRFALMLLCVT